MQRTVKNMLEAAATEFSNGYIGTQVNVSVHVRASQDGYTCLYKVTAFKRTADGSFFVPSNVAHLYAHNEGCFIEDKNLLINRMYVLFCSIRRNANVSPFYKEPIKNKKTILLCLSTLDC